MGNIPGTVATMTAGMAPGLRERKKADTRRALSDAAMELAFAHGLDNVTREDIASRAGVSLRTFTNYFAGKYEAVAYRQVDRIRRSIVLFRARPTDEPLWVAITESLLEPLESEGVGEVVPTREQLVDLQKLFLHPGIRVALSKELFDEWVVAIAERTGTDPAVDMYPRLVTAVVRAVVETAMDVYATADPPRPVTTVLRKGLAAVAAGLPEPTTRRKNA
jgi:AcrR family transcriptional regulator